MSVKQISVFLENKPGRLAQMTKLLAEHDIDIRALSLAETKDFGIARMIVDDPFSTANVLKDADFIAKFTPVLAYAVPDVPGGLNTLLSYFNDAGVNIEYMYAVLGSAHATMVFRVADTKAAEAALAAKGLKALSLEDIGAI